MPSLSAHRSPDGQQRHYEAVSLLPTLYTSAKSKNLPRSHGSEDPVPGIGPSSPLAPLEDTLPRPPSPLGSRESSVLLLTFKGVSFGKGAGVGTHCIWFIRSLFWF